MSNVGHIAQRTCLGCQKKQAQVDLVRFVLRKNNVYIDAHGTFAGRGAYTCQNKLCLETAIKRNAFHRAFRQTVKIDAERVIEEFSECLKKKS